ncbi:hypothetical protein AC3_A0669 [Clostridium perfringens E str. JGS1987]|uniref:Uncharacterized protein n=1 Tax=Clostridium perfringens E str. JGS1987 TaxID=451755 RepID=B1BVT4_CLOPF|nr:hypothetical protein AC3_A0669 [Clostridium perfringens E str. JGS1987]
MKKTNHNGTFSISAVLAHIRNIGMEYIYVYKFKGFKDSKINVK